MLGAFAYRIGLTPDGLDDLMRLARMLDAADWCLVLGLGSFVVGGAFIAVGFVLEALRRA